jgi:hypothetical protein
MLQNRMACDETTRRRSRDVGASAAAVVRPQCLRLRS